MHHLQNDDDELGIFFNQKAVKVEIPLQKESPKKQPKDIVKTVPMISMKAFIFNFKKFYKEKTKVRNLLSEQSAKQRNISLKIYLRNYFVKLYLIQQNYPDVKTMLLQTRISETQVLQRFEDMAFKNLADQKHVRAYVRNQQTDKLASQCKDLLEDLFLQKESSFYEKRVLSKFLYLILSTEHYVPFEYRDLIKEFRDGNNKKERQFKLIKKFIQGFIKVQKDYFKLVDVAHYLYQMKFVRDDVQIIMNFMNKVKGLYNQTQQFSKSSKVDGDQTLDSKLIQTMFEISINKDKTNNDLLIDVISNIKQLLNAQIRVDTVERVRKIMEYNIITDYLTKYYSDLDSQIQNQLSSIEQISNLIYSIDSLNLETKQDQLEVLLGFIYKVQNLQIESQTAEILLKHGTLLNNLYTQFELTIEQQQLQKGKLKLDMNGGIQPIKQILYDDDLKANNFTNPYDQKTADLPIRKAKQIDFSLIKPKIEYKPQEQMTIEVAEQYIEDFVEYEPDKDELMLSQYQEKIQHKESSYLRRDLIYEHEVSSLPKNLSKSQMIQQLQVQLQELRQQVALQQKL